MILILIVFRLVLYGAAEAVYLEQCEELRLEAYERYANRGSAEFVQATVDRHHDECVDAATRRRYRRGAELDRSKYFSEMDWRFGPRGPSSFYSPRRHPMPWDDR